MAEQHPWTGKAHDFPCLRFLSWFVAVNRTVGAGWFVVAVGTFLQPYIGVVEKFLTRCTGRISGPAVVC